MRVIISILSKFFPNVIVSLFNKEDVYKVLKVVEKEVFKDYEIIKILIPFNQGDIVSHLIESSNIISQEYSNEGTILELELSQIQISKYANYII